MKNIIFDFGGVVMDWDPRYFFKTYFNDDEKMEFFLENICTNEWNAEQDRGRSLKKATALLINQHPDWEKEIAAYYDHWTVMLKGDLPKNVEVLRKLEHQYPLFGLTNWSAELFPYALSNYDFFSVFEGKIVVSGDEKLIKPDPRIWEVLLDRYQLEAKDCIFIDDNAKNIEVATSLGFECIHILPETNLTLELNKLGVKF